ncbi:hypothetical protein [Nereida sp. MMG025]|uniref:hypothetical protein n=1 Tax=Nereida sp. MMG025 TaxID=2909981 RepID=UPI001F182A72|nr:hypothetical protein [Nereida sp. MMG025]MCF6445776.1 hypothetical protein [Nereida sp. MMG025]
MYYNPNHMVPVDPYAGQFAPQGAFGDGLAAVAPIAGGIATAVANGHQATRFMAPVIGGAVTAGTRAVGNWLPFQAGPGGYVQAPVMQEPVYAEPMAYAPQGAIGRWLGRSVGGFVGNKLGNRGAGQAVGGALGNLLPFQAGPSVYADPVYQEPIYQEPVGYAPQGVFGSALGSIAGGAIGGHFGHRDLGSAVGGLAGSFLPFQAGPEMGQPQFAPQGRWGDFIADVAPVVGNHVGGNWGRAISTVGGLADMLPFQAGPGGYPMQPVYQEQPVGFAPQGVLGGLAGGAVGGWIGKRLGNKNLGRAIGGGLGALLPFNAYGQPVYGQPVYGQPMVEPQNEQIVYH